MKRFFVTGISTAVGKTLAAAIITEALEADYWKPVQAGDLNTSDSHKITALISNTKTRIHPNSYALNTPMSPHAAAEIDRVAINVDSIIEPRTENHLVIEGAGGVLVPLNNKATILDIIQPDYKVILVSRHYLGSINHTLLTIECLQKAGLHITLLFNGEAHQSSESIILNKTGLRSLGRIQNEKSVDKEVIKKYANAFRSSLLSL